MTLFGMTLESFYLVLLIISGCLTLLLVFFGDFLEALDELPGFLSPILILAFITFFSAGSYILEKATTLNSFLIMVIAALVAALLDILLNVFVLVPLKSAEQSLGYTEKSLEGRVGKVIIPIPEDGFGEVVIESNSGMISKSAVSVDHQPIAEGKDVLVIDVKKGVLHVVPYTPTFK